MIPHHETVKLVGSGHELCVTETVRQCLNTGAFTDVTFLFPINTDDGTTATQFTSKLKAHRVVLAAASPFFDSMFSQIAESDEGHIVLMPGFDKTIFHYALHYIYNGIVSVTLSKSDLNKLLDLLETFSVTLPEKYFAAKTRRGTATKGELELLEFSRPNLDEDFQNPPSPLADVPLLDDAAPPEEVTTEKRLPLKKKPRKRKTTQTPAALKSSRPAVRVPRLVQNKGSIINSRININCVPQITETDVTLPTPTVGSLNWFSPFIEKACSLRTCLPKCLPEEKITDGTFFQNHVGIYDCDVIDLSSTDVEQERDQREHSLSSCPEIETSTDTPRKIYQNKSMKEESHAKVREENTFMLDIAEQLRQAPVEEQPAKRQPARNDNLYGLLAFGFELADLEDVVETEPEEAAENKEDFEKACHFLKSEQARERSLHKRLRLITTEIADSKTIASKILSHPLVSQRSLTPVPEEQLLLEVASTQQPRRKARDPNEKVVCEVCAKVVKRTYYRHHMVLHEGQRDLLCEHCGRAFYNRSNLGTHIRRQHSTENAKSYACQTCGKVFKSTSNLNKHVLIHTGIKPHLCQYCSKGFISRFLLTKHERIHTGERPYKCHLCPKAFVQRYTLDNHMNVHNKWKKFQRYVVTDETKNDRQVLQCEYCPSIFSRAETLLNHMALHTGQPPVYPCTHCEEKFSTTRQLHVHLVDSHADKYFSCPVCNIVLLSKASLRKHKAKHAEESVNNPSAKKKTYSCQICSCSYKSLQQLLVHERSAHTGEKPYSCDTCGKSFCGALNLAQHMLIHGSARPYKCSECDKSFRTAQHLKRHGVIHTGEKPFDCKHCGKAFSQKTNLSQHERIHMGTRHTCGVCNKIFPSAVKLKKHENSHFE